LCTLQLPKKLEVICEDAEYSIGKRYTRIDEKWIEMDLFPSSRYDGHYDFVDFESD